MEKIEKVEFTMIGGDGVGVTSLNDGVLPYLLEHLCDASGVC